MVLSIRSIALVALALTNYSVAGPVVKERELQKRDLPLVGSLTSLGTVLADAQADLTGLTTPAGITVAAVGDVVSGLGNIIGGMNGVISTAVTTTHTLTTAEFNQLQTAFSAMAAAFNAYLTALRTVAQAASSVYSLGAAATNPASTQLLNTAATSVTGALGSALSGLLGALGGVVTSLLGGVSAPATNSALVTGLRTVACLTNTVGVLLVPMTAAVNAVAAGITTPITAGTPQVPNTIPVAAAPLAGSCRSALTIFLRLGITV